MNLNKRISELENKAEADKPLPPVAWTEEEERFRNDIHNRMEESNAIFYHEVCTPEEFERVKRLSTKACLIWYRDKLKNERNESE